MSDAPGHDPLMPPSVTDDEQASTLTRRTVLAGAAAATVAATVVGTGAAAHAGSVDPNSLEDMVLFVLLSSALTGIPPAKLAPGFALAPAPTTPPTVPPPPVDLSRSVRGSDPVDIKREYLSWANDRYPSGLENLLNVVRKNLNLPNRDQAIIDALQFDDNDKNKTPADIDAKYLARSIVLMWYLGAWYEPGELQAARKDPERVPLFQVISPKAYTQAWALRIAQAHPMGYSEMQFGYWTRPPNDVKDFIGTAIT
jgi:hypothetical protein